MLRTFLSRLGSHSLIWNRRELGWGHAFDEESALGVLSRPVREKDGETNRGAADRS